MILAPRCIPRMRNTRQIRKSKQIFIYAMIAALIIEFNPMIAHMFTALHIIIWTS